MVLNAVDKERAERVLKRSIVKRDNVVTQFNVVVLLGSAIEKDSSKSQKLILAARLRDINTMLSEFHTEQDSIMDQLIALDRDSEFATLHAPIEVTIMEQFYLLKALASDNDLDASWSSDKSSVVNSHIQLPKIKLPSFDGDLSKWCSFRDTFTSLVHDNTQLTNVEKFHYLVSSVSGTASSIVCTLPLTDTNYIVAWEALHDSFDNKRLLITNHLDIIFRYTPLTTETLSGLKTFMSTFQENIAAISALEIDNLAGFLLFYIASRVLPSITKRLFEAEHHANEAPDITLLLKFIQTRCQILQNTTSNSAPVKNNITAGRKPIHIKSSFITSTEVKKSCLMCKESHFLFQCSKFEKMAVKDRFKFAQSRHLCMNCLSSQHKTSQCNSTYTCRYCSAKHHSLVHLEKRIVQNPSSSNQDQRRNVSSTINTPNCSNTSDAGVQFSGTTSTSSTIVLGTAVIRILNNYGQWIQVRSLIDSGSQISAITNACLLRLGLPRHRGKNVVVGLSQTLVTETKGTTTCVLIPLHSNCPELTCEPVILSRITGVMPTLKLHSTIRSSYADLTLADPHFDTPGPIEFLLGADIYTNILKDGGRVIHNPGLPHAYETLLGWVLSGQSTLQDAPVSVSLMVTTEPPLDKLLQQFWTIEEPSPPVHPFTDEEKAEEIFQRTTSRDNTGRYCVSLPFRGEPTKLGESFDMARSRFYNLERKLQRDPDIYEEYRKFMAEYEELGHMKRVPYKGKYLIPHHAVVKRDAQNIKVRVVFDASARSSSNCSLNQLLYVGPKLQQDISTLLLRSRFFPYMFTADICKMYRQIAITPKDRTYQHILWRPSPSDELCEYELCTITYGLSSSPLQAIRVLHQLEKDEGHDFPAARNILSQNTYVDDIINGTPSEDELLHQQKHIISLLARGGFLLKKWASNCPKVLEQVTPEDRILHLSFDPKDDASVKVLGLHWDPTADVFSYHTQLVLSSITKRAVLSTIAKLFDPIGALAPVIFWAKCFMQQLWHQGVKWDDLLPEHLNISWQSFSSQLVLLSNIKIPRHISISSTVQLLGFSDASEKGYAAVVYLRVVSSKTGISVNFITAKSKVAPLKSNQLDKCLSIPRLELCGALLLAQTLNRIHKILEQLVMHIEIRAWTDSTVVLSWLTVPDTSFKIFVSNRLAKIADLVPTCIWQYISSKENPADCVSRGLFPSQIIDHALYWHGPSFLKGEENMWPSNKIIYTPMSLLPEFKSPTGEITVLTLLSDNTEEWISRFSSLHHMQRVVSLIRRFIQRVKNMPSKNGPVTIDEFNDSLSLVTRLTQHQYFDNYFRILESSNNKLLPRAIARLAPFIDGNGIIRVGGRLRHSEIPFEQQCPMLLPKRCYLSYLLIRHFHFKFKHAGPQLISSLIANQYWILSARSAIRYVIFKCVVCTRHRTIFPQPIMAQLPSYRVRPSRPFCQVGIDFAGPFLTKEGRRKNARSIKTYLAVFVCMTIKAVHLEIVSDLTTDAFLAALNRFVSRRGIPMDIYSDCGTNFQGANRQLKNLIFDSHGQDNLIRNIQCNWHFNPPAAPHFGGLWEAAVKSTKYHLRRVIGSQILTFEELATLVTQIEAILNSRPLTAQSADPNDLLPLTPAHFLIGHPLVLILSPDCTSTLQNRLTRWELIKQCNQSFWKRWSAEYLSTLQSRSKWTKQQPNVKIGDLVLVRAPNQPPTHWKMGRIEQVHPGPDGVVRVATVRTVEGMIKRPVVKLAVLPIEDEDLSCITS